ncbi:hypothetical protein [Photobacterium sanguinicancri]|uniref:hypothetical protein n=1 Tax=Photobacterium sanguinicancri TaxID=875932 RepID=UPI001F149C5C|nr:hypothetical protein [Photobacterium sanguinicancri]
MNKQTEELLADTIMKNIAIVEDEAAIRENYTDVLKKHGYMVHGYDNRLMPCVLSNKNSLIWPLLILASRRNRRWIFVMPIITGNVTNRTYYFSDRSR